MTETRPWKGWLMMDPTSKFSLFSLGKEENACSMGTSHVSGTHIGVTSLDTLGTAYTPTSNGVTWSYQGAQYHQFAPQQGGVWGDQWISPISGGKALHMGATFGGRAPNNLMHSRLPRARNVHGHTS